jgi:hypothetical protein
MSNVIPFTDHRGKIFYPERCEIEVNGKTRKRWVVVTRESNGDESYHWVRTQKDAIWMAGILREAEAKRRKEDEFLATNELWQTMMLIPIERREIMLMLLEADKRRRTST